MVLKGERATSRGATSSTQRERIAQEIYDRLHPLMVWLAALFILVVVGDGLVEGESTFDTIFGAAIWFIWAAFALEYVVRMVIAPSTTSFLRRTWWQIIFLVLPFLGLLRIVGALRVARAGRAVSAAVRTSRTAARSLGSRVATLGAVTVVVILMATDLLYKLGDVRPYARALHDVTLAAISGEPIDSASGIAQILDVVLALYAVVVFATLAGAFGAFFFERRSGGEPAA